jgi:NDP-sugar pyrophosphorylase family protein
MDYKVLITTSGIGSRLGEITKYTNKCLVRIGTKPAISHIIDNYPAKTKFVITLGYFGNYVKDFVELAYPEKSFEFVNVKKYSGEGSSLLVSLLEAEKNLQMPFIYHVCDNITLDEIPEPEHNWISGYNARNSSSYASISLSDEKVINIHGKGHMNFDLLHTGLIGINDFKTFWEIANKINVENPTDTSLGDVDVLKQQISIDDFKVVKLKTWFDIGSISGLNLSRKKIANNEYDVLDKLAESIFKIDNYIIKFFSDSKLSKNRVDRKLFLKDNIPEIVDSRDNFFKYKYVDGKLFSHYANRKNFIRLIKWAEKNLWKPVEDVDYKKFKNDCKLFYYDKTIARIREFHLNKNIQDEENIINDEKVPKLQDLLKEVDFDELTRDKPSCFHGDFILDNVIQINENEFKLIDWRQDFSGNLEAGDMYYDLAKLSHNLVVNHGIIDKNLFQIEIKNDKIRVNINRIQTLVDCENIYFEYLKNNNYNVKKIKLLRAIIWLNMAPLHHHPFDNFLYYYGKYELYNALKNE